MVQGPSERGPWSPKRPERIAAASPSETREETPVIPIGTHRPASGEQAPGGRPPPTRIKTLIRVLVVQEEDDDFELIEDLLARAECCLFRLERASGAEAGLARLRTGGFDVGLVDYHLPGCNGISLIRQVRQHGIRTPLVLISGLALPDQEIEAIEAGAADYLEKEELDVQRLERAVRLVVARHRRNERPGRATPVAGIRGLVDASLYRDRLERALAAARRHRTLAALFLLDLEGTAALERRLGNGAGDRLRGTVAARLVKRVRETDTVAQLGEDEFAVLLEDLRHPEHAVLVAQKLQDALAQPAEIDGELVDIVASTGAALFPSDTIAATALHRLAEAARNRAKVGDGHRCRFHDPKLEARLYSDPGADELRAAIEAGALILHFQPQVTLSPAELGLASLVRWRHPEFGMIDGARIRALAEAAGLIEPLMDWMIAAACRQMRLWRESGLPPFHLALPLLSRRQLAWSGLPEHLGRHLAQAGIRPEWLELEIDERLLYEELQAGGEALQAVRQLGLRLAVDGFGSGPTSLTVLRDAPLTTLKLARPMLQRTPDDPYRTLFAGAVIALGRQLGLRLVAEGLESQAQLQMLKAQGCHAVQSFISCPPLPADACTDWLRQAAQRL